MAEKQKCGVCGCEYTGGACPECKARLEKEHSAQMNQEAVERIKKEVITQEEADRVEAVFFEDDAQIKLRDGKTYRIPPCKLKKARRLMQLLKTVNVDVVMLNFIPTGNDTEDEQREKDLYEILEMAFEYYPEVTREYIEDNVDVELANKIITILIGLNSLKK